MGARLPVAAKPLLAYADGSCIGNPGPGGWGVVIVMPNGERVELSGSERDTTNNKMELTAAIEALRATERGASVVLRSDSEYVVKGINEHRKRKANGDRWDQLDAEIADRRVTLEWVRGHADDPLNRRADELAHGQAERIARGGPPAAGKPSPRAKTNRAGDEHTLAALRPMLREDETVRECAGCGRMFVAKRAHYCALAECQLKARRAMKPV
jgi:ribonuclease HI